MDFKEFLRIQEFKIRGVEIIPSPTVSIPKTGIRLSGAARMNPVAVVSPSRPYQPFYRMGKSQVKSQIALKKH